MKLKIPGQLWDFEKNQQQTYSENNEVYVDGLLYDNTKIFVERLIHNFDSWIILSGDKGDGKSLKAKQIAYMALYILKFFFNITSKVLISWTPQQLRKDVMTCDRYSILIYDEAISGLSARRAMSIINTTLLSLAAQCRKKNLLVLVVLPAFHDLDKSIAIHRSRALVQVYTHEFDRGYFSYFTKAQKLKLYVLGKKFYDMQCVQPEFRGRYTLWSFVNELEYEAGKDSAAFQQGEEMDSKRKWSAQRNACFYLLEKLGWTHAKISEEVVKISGVPLARNTVTEGIHALNYKEEAEK